MSHVDFALVEQKEVTKLEVCTLIGLGIKWNRRHLHTLVSYAAGTCLSFSSEDENLFVVGSENGGLYKCSLQSSSAPSTLEKDLGSPIRFVFRPHHGPVYGISASPFHRNLFLSCGTDATARIYSLLDVSWLYSRTYTCSGYIMLLRSWSHSSSK